MPLKIKNGETILFVGDSITDAGRRGVAAPLGGGFVKIFSELQIIREPEKKIDIVNRGIGGDNTRGLCSRWFEDVLVHEPDWLCVLIGFNDLGTHLFRPPPWVKPNPVTPGEYEKNYDEILSRTRRKLPKCKILLIDSFYMSIDRPQSRRWPKDFEGLNFFSRPEVLAMLPRYLAVVEKMAGKYRARHVRMHKVFQDLLKYHDSDVFCQEPIHPFDTGNFAIAEGVYRALSK